jgi:hypothetical protein
LKIAIRGVEISRLQRKEKYLSLLKNTKTTANFVVFQYFPSSYKVLKAQHNVQC